MWARSGRYKEARGENRLSNGRVLGSKNMILWLRLQGIDSKFAPWFCCLSPCCGTCNSTLRGHVSMPFSEKVAGLCTTTPENYSSNGYNDRAHERKFRLVLGWVFPPNFVTWKVKKVEFLNMRKKFWTKIGRWIEHSMRHFPVQLERSRVFYTALFIKLYLKLGNFLYKSKTDNHKTE